MRTATYQMGMMLRNKSLRLALATTASILIGVGPSDADQSDQSNLVANTKISGPVLTFDWPAIEVGVGSYEEGPTGLTVIRFPTRASVAVDARGGALGTVNTDALRLGYARRFTDAVVFSGGSAYGEEPITAVETGLKDEGVRSGDRRNVAFVPGAVIYDFGSRRLNEIYPDKRLARAVLRAMRPGVFPLGAQGAGRMAMQGGFFGCDAHSGQGGAFRQLGTIKIAAFVVVNASGAVVDRNGRLVSCNAPKSWGNMDRISEILQQIPAILRKDQLPPATSPDREIPATKNTTVSLIVTNRKLNYAALQRMAIQVHTSIARGIQPFSTESDGDTLYAASTQEVDGKDVSPEVLATLGGEVMWDAVLASVPTEAAFVPPAKPPSVSPEKLAAYAGLYEFGAEPTPIGASFSGLGLEIAVENDLPKVSPIEGGPAARAGVMPGDVVTELDGAPLEGLALDELLDRMRGPKGSRAELTINRRDQSQPIEITVIREPIRLRSVLRVRVAGNSIAIEAVGGRQVFEFQRTEPLTLVPLSDTEFFVDGRYHTRIAFTQDATGKVVGAVLNPGRWEQKGLRLE